MGRSLSGRLLILTIAVVAALQLVVLAPSVARFRYDYLQERLRIAHLATLSALAAPDGAPEGQLQEELLARARADSMVLRRGGEKALALSAVIPKPIDASFDLREAGPLRLLGDAFAAFVAPAGRNIRVIGQPYESEPDIVEITIAEAPLTAEAVSFARRLLALSLAACGVTAALIYFAIGRLLIRPIERISANMTAFRDDPEDASRVMRPASPIREIAAAELALSDLQRQVNESLRQRARMAALGEAVGKISHDLRNMLAGAQIAADSIDRSADPMARRAGARLVSAVNRAIRLCETTLRFGKAEEAAPEPRDIELRALVDEVAAALPPAGDEEIRLENRAPAGLLVCADPEQLFRILSNLARNGQEAMRAAGRSGVVAVEARSGENGVEIDIVDSGPGLPEKALAALFQPFRGSARAGGFGLGLPIAQELARLQGGRLSLVSTGSEGARFRLSLPAAQAQAA